MELASGLRTGGIDNYRHQHIMGSSYSSEDERRKSGARQKAPIEIAIDVAFTQERFGQRWYWTSDDALISPDVVNPASIAEVKDLRSGLGHYRRVILGANVTKRVDSDWPECPNCGATFRPGVIFCPACGYEEDGAQNKHLNTWVQQLVREDLDSDYGSFAPRERNPNQMGLTVRTRPSSAFKHAKSRSEILAPKKLHYWGRSDRWDRTPSIEHNAPRWV